VTHCLILGVGFRGQAILSDDDITEIGCLSKGHCH